MTSETSGLGSPTFGIFCG